MDTIKENQITFNLDSDLLNEFKSIVEKENTTMDRALKVAMKMFIKNVDFINETKKYNSDGVEYVSDEEQAEIESNTELMESIARAEKEIREGKGIIVNR